jgi:hypothetical protein
MVFLMGIGLVLVFFQGTKSVSVEVKQQQTLCQVSLGKALSSYHDFEESCLAVRGSWADLSLTSSVPVNLDVLFSQGQDHLPSLLYNRTGTQITGHFPLFSDGAVLVHVTNQGNSTAIVSGSLTSSAEKNVSSSLVTKTFPHRGAGIALTGASAIVLFVMVWNPRKIATSTLDRIRRSPKSSA